MQKDFKRDMRSLEKVFDFLHTFMQQHEVNDETIHTMDLVVEELFTNMVKYNPTAPEDVSISLGKSGNILSVCLIDPNAQPFDLTKKEDPKLDIPLSERTPGGLGIYLTKKLTDSLHYEYQHGKSVITVTKRLE
jgi:anti-sigma regulatory factor (Ser/Thr protein kinase)